MKCLQFCHLLITLCRDVFSQILPKSEHNGVKIQNLGPDDLNVLVIFVESISRLTWLRHASDVHQYLTKELGSCFWCLPQNIVRSASPVHESQAMMCKSRQSQVQVKSRSAWLCIKSSQVQVRSPKKLTKSSQVQVHFLKNLIKSSPSSS